MIRLAFQRKVQSAAGPMQLEVDQQLETGKIYALFGPSGSGKTTLLRLIAGLIRPNQGIISVDDVVWNDKTKNIFLPTQKRSLGFVFQDFALFPNMTIRQNLEFALSKGQSKTIIDELLETIELTELAHRLPQKLSGGQQQRVALARALVRRPKILLMDEALSAIDWEIRSSLQKYILDFHQSLGLTIIMVTHDLKEIFRMAHQVLLLREGKIIKTDSPENVFLSEQGNAPHAIKARVQSILPTEQQTVLQVQIGDQMIKLMVNPEEANNLVIGDTISVSVHPMHPVNIVKM